MSLQQKYLNAQRRQEGFLDIFMYVPDNSVSIASVESTDVLQYSNIDSIKNIENYTSSTIATLEENLWLLNGRFLNVIEGTTVDGYISDSMSDDNSEFFSDPKIDVTLAKKSHVEDFSVILNPAAPSAYPERIILTCYNGNSVVNEFVEIIRNVDTLPSVIFHVDLSNITKIRITFHKTQYPNKRIRVSSLLFGKVIYLNQDLIMSSEFVDKTPYVVDTIPSRTFSFTVNNYSGDFNVDNPKNNYLKLDSNTEVMFRYGYNIAGYQKDDSGELIYDESGFPIVNNPDGIVQTEWGSWKKLRLMNTQVNADESITFECGSILDIMTDIYTHEYYEGGERTVGSIINDILAFEGFSSSVMQYSYDDINKQMTMYNSGGKTHYNEYTINTVLPELPCRELIQLLAFSVGATMLLKDDGHIKFANLNLNKPTSFTNQYSFSYKDFESIPAAEQLETVSKLTDISLPKYSSKVDTTKGIQELATIDVTAMNAEITYSECQPTGINMAKDDKSGASIQSSMLYAHRGVIRLGGLASGKTAKVVVYGYPVITQQTQERTVTSNALILDTKLMNYDPSDCDKNNVIVTREMIKNKYLTWYNKKFKYTITTRGEPLVNGGDYCTIQTQFTDKLNCYVLQNRVVFDGTWSGDMEVISLGD